MIGGEWKRAEGRVPFVEKAAGAALSGLVPSLPGTPADHFRPCGLRCFTTNIDPRRDIIVE
jgi:hypothetical protein